MKGWLVTEVLSAGNGWDLKKKIEALSQWSNHTNIYSYEESLMACHLTIKQWEDIKFTEEQWEGRLFNEGCEVRWVNQYNKGFVAWLNYETKTPQEKATAVYWQDKRYYLHGEYDPKSECPTAGTYIFNEGRFPHKDFVYPLKTTPKPHDRAYINVREYFRTEPDWSTLNDDNDIQEILEAPLLIGHRFMDVQAGQDEGK